MSYYRTRTYLAGDWDTDYVVIDKLRKWNKSNHWNLSFSDAHDLMQSRDTSLCCSIKKSLRDRLNASKRFVLVVGENTDKITSGGCQRCGNYLSAIKECLRGYSVDYRSYVHYECEYAYNHDLDVVVIYNDFVVDKTLCPSVLRDIGLHLPFCTYNSAGIYAYNYMGIQAAFNTEM